jgi:hypothetical protein
MPIDKSNYPKNWKEISATVQRSQGYICQFCGFGRIPHNPLTTHHIDNDPMNCDYELLKTLHASCHLLFHTRHASCRTLSIFLEICRNNLSQTKFDFIREFEQKETGKQFIRYKIRHSYRRQKCLQSFSAENSLSLL